MSVLSSPQGTPERVWSLVAGLQALGGETDRAAFDALINPGYVKDGAEIRAKDTLAANALGAASSLGLVQSGRDKAVLGEGVAIANYAALADHVHDRLAALPSANSDCAILDAYAWVAAESDRQKGLGWIYEWGRDQFADEANKSLVGEDEDGRLMNTTKVVPWRRWLNFLGLGATLPLANTPDFPTPTLRIARELERAGIEPGSELTAEAFLTLLAGRMPYLDRGRLFIQACQRIGHQSLQRQLSPLLSVALRDLHDDDTVKLRLSGDASTHVRLAPDPAHAMQAFTAVKIFPEASS
jgi:hypothetical protein